MTWIAAGVKTIEYERASPDDDPRRAVEGFHRRFGFPPDMVEDPDRDGPGTLIAVVGICEGCRGAILDGDEYGADLDGWCLTCPDCWKPEGEDTGDDVQD